jgi:signal transduction histidine kinase
LSLNQDVLDISKIEAGKLTLRPEVGDLDQMFHDLQSTALPLAAKNANMLVFECDGSLGRAFLDIVKLRQCALNLLSNACKFTRNGAITARFRRDLSISGDVLRIEVTDTGMGISEEKRRQLFEPFVQAHELTIEGAGLGLAITRRLCELMGGAVSVTSVLGEGSTFTITLPIPAIEACAAA